MTQLEPSAGARQQLQGDPIDCLGGVINDVAADSRGGVYFTMGGVYYADPKGVVTEYGEGLRTERHRPEAGREDVVCHQRSGDRCVRGAGRTGHSPTSASSASSKPGGGDGLTVDAAGGSMSRNGRRSGSSVPTASTSGTFPRRANSSRRRSAGKDKKTFFILARGATTADGTEVANAAQVWSIPMIAQGFGRRAK